MKPYLKYGLHMAIALCLIDLVGTRVALGAADFLLTVGILVAGMYLAMRDTRHMEGEHLSFNRGFGVGMSASLIAAGILAVYNYVKYKFIYHEYITDLRKVTIEEAEKNPRFKKEDLDQLDSMINTVISPGSMAVGSFIGMMLLCLVVGLIVAAAMKKEDPHGGMDFPPRA